MSRVTVVIPAYNGISRYLDQAIGSVLVQTYRDFELIVVDDASSDDTGGLIARYPGIRYVRRPKNGGQAAARNDGGRAAGGEFLAFLDQDDLWEPGFLEHTVATLVGHLNVALVHSDGTQVTERNKVLHYDAAMKRTSSITQLLRGGHDTATSGSLLRASCFDAVGGYDEALCIWEDIDLAIRLYQRFPILHLPQPLYRHRLYGHNASRGITSDRALLGRRRFLEKHAPACQPGTAEGRALARDWAQFYSDLGKHYLRTGAIVDARRAFQHSLRQNPFSHKAILRLLRSYVTIA